MQSSMVLGSADSLFNCSLNRSIPRWLSWLLAQSTLCLIALTIVYNRWVAPSLDRLASRSVSVCNQGELVASVTTASHSFSKSGIRWRNTNVGSQTLLARSHWILQKIRTWEPLYLYRKALQKKLCLHFCLLHHFICSKPFCASTIG